ncbi:MAG: HDOD domain-containing protein [Deltaproteobacteria bacterium]|nr:HDOD domain-containing protein [Deltaproteobacteria bacterium]
MNLETVPAPPPCSLADAVLEELWFGDDDPQRSSLEASQSLASAVADATGLKSFPAVAQRVLALLAEPDVQLSKVQEAMEADPSLASQLLRLANSAAFRPRRPYSSLEQAIVRLGTRQVSDLVAGVATLGLFRETGGIGPRVRDHSVGVAAIARVLATQARDPAVGVAFLAGLLHDVGKLLSLQVAEMPYEALPDELLEAPDRVHVEERVRLGYDHAVLGAHVLQKWNMDSLLTQVVAWHHQPVRAYEAGGDVAKVVAYLRVANRAEYLLARDEKPDDAIFESFAKDAANSWLDHSADVYRALWPELNDARQDLLAALG